MTLEDAYPVIVTDTLAECREYTRGTRFPQIEPRILGAVHALTADRAGTKEGGPGERCIKN